MPEPITWGQLPKSQIDPERIEEAIARMIKEHNEDESAHLGPGQSLQSHKASEIIDHAVKSILAEKLHPSAQVAQCVVAPEGGDFTSISDALKAGYKRIYVKAATYTINSPIVISSNDVVIEGEPNATLKLASGVNDSVIKIIGDVENFVSNIVIRNITINGNKANQTAGHGILIKYAQNVLIEKCTITQCKQAGIYIHECFYVRVLSNYISYCTYGLYTTLDVSENEGHIISSNVIESLDLCGIYLHEVRKSIISNNVVDGVFSSSGDALYIHSYSELNLIINNFFSLAKRDGIRVAGSSNLILGNFCLWNSAYGINILSGATKNAVRINYLYGNYTGSMVDNGTKTQKAASTTNDNIV